jgi:hypothetical protein
MRRFPALLLALACAPAFAQEVRGPYIGFGIDQIDYSAPLYRVELDDTAMSQKLVAGFRFSETLAFEAYYAESDEFVANESGWVQPWTSPIGPIGFDTTATIVGTFDSFEVRALTHQGAWVLGVGYFSADAKFDLSGTSGFGPFAGGWENSDSGFSIIIGGQWDIGDFGIRAEYSYYDLEADADGSSLGVGMQYRF